MNLHFCESGEVAQPHRDYGIAGVGSWQRMCRMCWLRQRARAGRAGGWGEAAEHGTRLWFGPGHIEGPDMILMDANTSYNYVLCAARPWPRRLVARRGGWGLVVAWLG